MSKPEDILNRIYDQALPEPADLEQALSWDKPQELERLFNFADTVRKEYCGDGIIPRGIIEFSNFCYKECSYCGLNKNNRKLGRYRMKAEEVLKSAGHLFSCGIRTVVLQSGEDPGSDVSWLAEMIKQIKSQFALSITLCVGERPFQDYRRWKDAGADRYLLKIETSDKELYRQMHPGMSFEQRIGCLDALRESGYQVGSGNIVGLPGQSRESLARDILFFKQNNFDMIGIGPFIAHQETRLAGQPKGQALLTLKVLALARIATRNAHLPATTALGSLGEDYRQEGLKCGANVLMPNFTPLPYRKLYEIYPDKKCVNEPVGACNFCMEQMAKQINRFIDYTKGDSLKFKGVTLNV